MSTERGGAISDEREQEPTAAEGLERFFGPSIFEAWARALLEHAAPKAGDRVLDLACATGIVARRVEPVVGATGRVVGLDLNPEMLAVARQESAGQSIEWREGDAEDLDFEDDSFDLVLCLQGLQFFPAPEAALGEAERVLAPGGRIVVTAWQPLDRHPVYSDLLKAEARHLGADLANIARPFQFGDDARLRELLEGAGFGGVEVVEKTLEAEFDEPEAFVALTLVAGAAVVPELAPDAPEERDALIEAVTRDSEATLRRYRDGDRLRFPMPNYVGRGHL